MPPEILDRIAGKVDGPRAPLAAVSCNWQRAVERRTFSAIRIGSDMLDQFDAAFDRLGAEYRHSFLKELRCTITLPNVSLGATGSL